MCNKVKNTVAVLDTCLMWSIKVKPLGQCDTHVCASLDRQSRNQAAVDLDQQPKTNLQSKHVLHLALSLLGVSVTLQDKDKLVIDKLNCYRCWLAIMPSHSVGSSLQKICLSRELSHDEQLCLAQWLIGIIKILLEQSLRWVDTPWSHSKNKIILIKAVRKPTSISVFKRI